MEEVIALIRSLTGVDVTDDSIINFVYNSEKQHILNCCNLNELPNEFEYVVIERTAGRYLELKIKDVLSDEDLNVVTSIKEGDTQVNFGNANNETRLKGVIASLLRGRESDMACYRKLKW